MDGMVTLNGEVWKLQVTVVPSPDTVHGYIGRALGMQAQGEQGDVAAPRAAGDRGMAVDFDWRTASAPAYLAAYQRAIDIRRPNVTSP